MEISFENRAVNIYREVSHQTKRIQETAESVVPDTNDDIGKIASVQTSVLMKSKDVSSRGVIVTGELSAALLYITESENSVSFLRLSKSFTLEYDIGEAAGDELAQVKLSIQNCEARVLNPRKVSVTFDLMGEMSCYRENSVCVQTELPADAPEGLYAKFEQASLAAANTVTEKTFAVNEQFVFPSGKPKPSQIVNQQVNFILAEPQMIGTKVIIKGSVFISLCYLSNEVNYPLKAEFTAPFSQIIDTDKEQQEHCCAFIELTSCYGDIVDTINGEKALDAEIHAVVQLVCYSRESVEYVSDAYSNLMPCECAVQARKLSMVSPAQELKLSADERINVVEDCEDVLSVFPTLSQVTLFQDKFTAAVTLDIVYRSSGGALCAVKRLVNMEAEVSAAQARLIDAHIADDYLRPDGAYIDAHITVSLSYQFSSSQEITCVESASLNEDAAFDSMQFPAVTLVRVEHESLWQLAKTYHSSVDRIKEFNALDDGLEGKMLLIPKAT